VSGFAGRFEGLIIFIQLTVITVEEYYVSTRRVGWRKEACLAADGLRADFLKMATISTANIIIFY
jgi:hypothetical protein